MEFSWATFFLEVINFLILVWILKYFLYQPVMNIIEQRKASIQKDLDDAREMHQQSQLLQQQYENRLQDWEEEKQRSRSKMLEDISLERERLMQQLQESLKQEHQKAEILQQRQLLETKKISQQQALDSGARFTAQLLSRLASEELESRLLELLLQDLNTLSEEQKETLRTTALEQEPVIMIISAYDLSQARRQKLERMLYQLTSVRLDFSYQIDPQLLAGVRVVLGPWILHANLQDELQFFSESVYD